MDHYDRLEIRCPRLGHDVAFFYCRRESGELPCARILSCWQPFFPVEAYLRDNMPPDLWRRFTKQVPKEKIITLIDLIEAARKRLEDNRET